MVEMVEILDGRLGKRSVASKVCNKQFITLGHCEIWSHFTRTLYFHSPSARDNTVATRSSYSTLTRAISLIGERARHSQVCSIENRGYIYIAYYTSKSGIWLVIS